MYCENQKVFIEDEDQCATCENFKKGAICPLIQALGMGVVQLEGDLIVENCSFYKEFSRHLSLVKPLKEDS